MIVCPWKDIKKYAALLPGIDEAFDAVNALTEYENKLGLVEKFVKSSQALEEIEREIDEIAAAAADAAILEKLAKVKDIIVSLEE